MVTLSKVQLARLPPWYLPRLILPGVKVNAGEEWVRGVFQNGRHRLLESERLGSHDPWRVAQLLVHFDAWCRPGCLVAVVDFDMTSGEANTEALVASNVVALSRLSSVAGVDQYEGQGYVTQRWVNLDLERLPRG